MMEHGFTWVQYPLGKNFIRWSLLLSGGSLFLLWSNHVVIHKQELGNITSWLWAPQLYNQECFTDQRSSAFLVKKKHECHKTMPPEFLSSNLSPTVIPATLFSPSNLDPSSAFHVSSLVFLFLLSEELAPCHTSPY